MAVARPLAGPVAILLETAAMRLESTGANRENRENREMESEISVLSVRFCLDKAERHKSTLTAIGFAQGLAASLTRDMRTAACLSGKA